MQTCRAAPVCLLLIAVCAAAAKSKGPSELELLTGYCPRLPTEPADATGVSESECLLRCHLSPDCRLSMYQRLAKACHNLNSVPPMSEICNSWTVVRGKLLPKPAALKSLSFFSKLVLFYDFKKGFENFVDPYRNPAEPVNIAGQNSIDGVKLKGSSSSYVKVSTPGLNKYFLDGQFSFFFRGKFKQSSSSCLGSFAGSLMHSFFFSHWWVKDDSKIQAKFHMYFFSGHYYETSWTSQSTALSSDSVQRDVSIGLSYNGTNFAHQAFFNSSALGKNSLSSSSGSTEEFPSFHDNLLIGKCITDSIEPLDGWVQCWALVAGTLSLSQFHELHSLCN